MNHTRKLFCMLLTLTLVLGVIFCGNPALPTNAATGEPEIPEFTGGSATYGSSVHDAGPTPDGGCNYQKTYSGVTAAAVQAYEQKLRDAGFTLYDEREIKNSPYTNRFATYVNDASVMVHINYFPALSVNQFQIIYGSAKYLIPTTQAGSYEAVVTPSVSIIERTDGVLCMVVQLADGSYVVIDGGYGFSATSDYTIPANVSHRDGSGITYTYRRDHKKDMATLLAFLQDTNRDGSIDSKDSRPKVTWMITHGDPDHVQLPYVFMQTYHSKFDLNAVVYNFPNFYNIGLSGSYNKEDLTKKTQTGFIEYTKKYFPNTKHYIYHTGQILNLPGCQIEFLYTQEDHFPNKMTTPNHTCGIWRFNFDGGKSLLITGDAEIETNRQATKVLGSYLQSDMMQVIHHGSNGATTDFYNAVDPDICFWPCLDTSFYHDKRHLGSYSGFSFNKILRTGNRTHYTASKSNTVFVPTLRYDANGGSGNMDAVTVLYSGVKAGEGTSPNGKITVAANTFTGPGNKVFHGWTTTPNGAVQYRPGDQITVSGNTVLYAVWGPASYTVTFMDGDRVIKTETVQPGANVALPELPEKAGYTASWDHDGKNITGNTTINVVYTPVATEAPTQVPTEIPTEEPTQAPTSEPTQEPTQNATSESTQTPTEEQTVGTPSDGTTVGTVSADEPESDLMVLFLVIGVILAVGVITVVVVIKRKNT